MKPTGGTGLFGLRVFFNRRRLEILWRFYLVIWLIELLSNIAPMFMHESPSGVVFWMAWLVVPLNLVARLAVVRLLIEVALVLLTDSGSKADASGNVA